MEKSFLERLTQIVEENISNSLFGADELARQMGMSHSSLFRKVQTLTGKSINHFIRDMRLQKSLELLQQEEITAAEAAYRTGFGSAAYFNTCFHEHFGFPPGEAKKNENGTRVIPESSVVHPHIAESRHHSNQHGKSRKTRSKWLERIGVSGIAGLVVLVVGLLLITVLRDSKGARVNPYHAEEKTIAVLPFDKISNDTTVQYICDAFVAELQVKLGDIKSLTLMQAMSTEEYLRIRKSGENPGNLLKANSLITGKLGIDSNMLKVWVYLIDNKTKRQIWSLNTQANLRDFFSVEEEIVQTIASKLKATLSPEEMLKIEKKPTENDAAYGFYSLGNYYSDISHSANFATAAQYYQKAIDLDPGFTLAYLGKADALVQLYASFGDRRDEVLMESKKAIDKALQLEPDLPEAHYVLGNYLKMGICQAENALKEYEITLKSQPNHFEALYGMAKAYANLGNLKKSIYYANKAIALNPRNVSCLLFLGSYYKDTGEFQKALEYYDLCCNINPWSPYPYLARANISISWQGDTQTARKQLDAGVGANPDYSDYELLYYDFNYYLIDLYEGKYEQALARVNGEINKRLRNCNTEHFPVSGGSFFPVHLCRATLYGLLGKPELERAWYDSTRLYLLSLDSTKQKDLGVNFAYGIVYAGLGLKDKLNERLDLLKGILQEDIKVGWAGLANIYVLQGRYPEAIEQLELLLTHPSGITAQLIKLDPRWTPLRKLPAYKKMIGGY